MPRAFIHYKFQLSWVSGLLLAGLLLALFKTAPVYAGGVVGTGTSASCTEAAFDTALIGGGAITFNCGGPKTITITFYKQIAADTTIDGSGLITLSGSNTYLFQVFFGRSLTLQNITLADGLSNAAGAVENFGTTYLVNSQLLNNRSTNTGGAILNYGTFSLTNAVLSNNRAANGGGGIYNDGGIVNITNSQLISNVVTGATGTGGGITNQAGSMTLNGVTLSGNMAGGNGGGIYSNVSAILTNVTLSGNRTTSPGSGGGGMYQNGGNATLNFVTVANNTAPAFGGGVFNNNLAGASMTLRNTLLANNTIGNCDGIVVSLGHNLSSDTNCAAFTQTGDQQNVSLPLGPLADNGGPTLTHLPLSGNPAINGGECVAGITADQRGWNRPSGSTCDVGAVEVGELLYLPVIIK
jgi:hypothetical protein